jgi:hypothetical protein
MVVDLKQAMANWKADLNNPDPIGAMIKNKEACVPEAGFNVVVLDDFEPPGKQLSVWRTVGTEQKAREVAEQAQRDNPKMVVYVYGADGAGWKVGE